MSEIKLDDAKDMWYQWSDSDPLAWVQSIQDRTLETAAKLLEQDAGCRVSSARIVRSLKNKRADEEKVRKTKELLTALRAAHRHIMDLEGHDSRDVLRLGGMINHYMEQLDPGGA